MAAMEQVPSTADTSKRRTSDSPFGHVKTRRAPENLRGLKEKAAPTQFQVALKRNRASKPALEMKICSTSWSLHRTRTIGFTLIFSEKILKLHVRHIFSVFPDGRVASFLE